MAPMQPLSLILKEAALVAHE
ncbi:hypothetical protein CCACVL1_20154 [Corchorus capsularis]|uniref:Uncharacterized protein n=1 Tax=Corchorus capsularis TaxID=210143 RepID=A0A1R3HC85_COCAP|nr:hypothetical protein CCACVL1_20154 [Corchorus capsularis]